MAGELRKDRATVGSSRSALSLEDCEISPSGHLGDVEVAFQLGDGHAAGRLQEIGDPAPPLFGKDSANLVFVYGRSPPSRPRFLSGTNIIYHEPRRQAMDSERFAGFSGCQPIKGTSRRRGSCTPSTRRNSKSEVAEGPDTKMSGAQEWAAAAMSSLSVDRRQRPLHRH